MIEKTKSKEELRWLILILYDKYDEEKIALLFQQAYYLFLLILKSQ